MPTMIKTINVHRTGDNPIFGESVTSISLDDEAGGAFIVIKQCSDSSQGKILVDPDELEEIYLTAKRLLEQTECHND